MAGQGEAAVDRIINARVNSEPWYLRYHRTLPLVVFGLTLAITLLSLAAIRRADTESLHARMRAMSDGVASALERRANDHIAYLRAGAILFEQGAKVDRAHFDAYAGRLLSDPGFRGAEGIGWAHYALPEQLSAFEASRRKEDEPAFTVHPRGSGAMSIVTYLYPTSLRNRRALGYDMMSETQRRQAMVAAMSSGQPVASGRVVLVQEGPENTRPGFIIYMPVHAAPAEGHAIKGFIYSPFNAGTFLSSALELVVRPEDFGIALYDGDASPGNLLARAGAGPRGWQYARPVVVAGRRLTIEIGEPRNPVLSPLALVTLAFGMLVAALLAVVARLVTAQAEEDRASLDWLREQASIRASLTRELNHRVKNTLAGVLSIIALTRRRAASLDDFAESLQGRIRALSATHDLLTQREWGATPLGAVIAAELAPYTQGEDPVVELSGPPVMLAPNDALTLGLAVHELATNAAKYGALSVISGRVKVCWAMVTSDLARVEWRESGGPPVASEPPKGFGTELIERIVAHELGHQVDLRFEPCGVCCDLLVPVRQPAVFQIRARR